MTTEEHHAHLPECWNTFVSDPTVSCICDELRDCEERVARAFHQVRADDGVEWARFAREQFDKGYADAITQAVHRIESLPAAAIRGYVGVTETQVTAALKELKGDG